MAASSSSHPRCTYDVFLSFRGEDTRKGFTDHLYMALEGTGIRTFRDDDEIPRGTPIQQELEKAIQESRLSIVVFSKDYASSRWCLDELVKITQRTKTSDGHIIIPVFYDVDPSDVRNQTGSFAQAFSSHEQRFKEEMDRVEEWRRALRDVPGLAGMVLGDRSESKFIQDIVDDVWNKLDRKALDVPSYLVGVVDRVGEINKWLKDGSDDVGMAVICGMGGIGKTTIAKIAYNHNFNRFEGSSFLADVRERSEQPKGLLDLQRQLLSNIQKKKTKKPYSQDEGKQKIKGVVSRKSVLIVLDDVDDVEQLSKILGDRKWFLPRSKIIITTRCKHLLKDPHEVYEMFGLSESESFMLFNRHAFGQANHVKGFKELSRPLVKHCEGLPLALQVLGSSLSGKSIEIWQDASRNLDVITEGKIEKILRISFDSLPVRDRSLFLHLACFFIRKKEDFAITVLDNCGFATRIGLQNLINRCLVEFDPTNKLVIHALLRDMAMEIIREESPEDPGKRSRALHKDAINILRKLTGTETIKGLILIEHEIGFKTEAFTRMRSLEILVLKNVKFSGSYEHFPKNLIWLYWSGFPEISIPTNFCLADVVALHLMNSSLRNDWKETPRLLSLKILNLSHSHDLMTTPDFTRLPNLERLVLQECINLVKVDESVGVLGKLVFLNMKNCRSLKTLPRSIFTLQSLQKLVLSGCSKLEHYHHNNAIATNHQWLLSRRNVELSSFSLANLSNWLSNLSLANCNISEISSDICFPSSLKELDLEGIPISSLPENMKHLIMLQSLRVAYCTKLRALPELPPNLQHLEAVGCKSLERVTNLPNFLPKLYLKEYNCEEIELGQSLFIIQPLRSFGKEMKQLLPQITLFDFESEEIERDELVQMHNYLTCTYRRKLPSQALYEYGIFSTFLNGCKIPESFSCHKSSDGKSVLSITLPRPNSVDYDDLNCKIRGLNICVVYEFECTCPMAELILTVSNKNKGLMWVYLPVTMRVPEKGEGVIWMSHWLFEDEHLEVGDTICVSVKSVFSIEEFGVQVVYENEHENNCMPLSNSDGGDDEDVAMQLEPETTPSASSSSRQNYHNNVGASVSAASSTYKSKPRKYFLCNHPVYRMGGLIIIGYSLGIERFFYGCQDRVTFNVEVDDGNDEDTADNDEDKDEEDDNDEYKDDYESEYEDEYD